MLSPLQTPRVLALFRHDTFEPFQFESSPKDDDGFVLILVPESSPLRSAAQLEAVLGELDSTVSRLSALLPASSILVPSEAGTLSNLASLLVGIRQLAGALSQPHVRFRVRNSVDDLVAIHMIKRSFAGIDPVERDVRAGDEISSLIFIGLPGDKVRCWNNKNFHNEDRQRKGQLLITIGPEMIVAITNLNSASPPTEPVGRAQVVISANKPDAFGDAFESLKFEFPPEQE